MSRAYLVKELIKRNLAVRYKRPVLGAVWTVLSPLMLVGVLYFVFRVLLRVNTPGVPFVLYLMTAVFPWRFFQDSVSEAVTSLVDNRNLLRESRMPPFCIILAAVLTNAAAFVPAMIVVTAAAWAITGSLPWTVIFLPVTVAVHAVMAVSVGCVGAVIYVFWRDTKYAVDLILTFIFYLTPVFYPVLLIKEALPGRMFDIYAANPFACIMDLYRISIISGFPASSAVNRLFFMNIVWVSLFCAGGILAARLVYKTNERVLADHLSY